MEKMTNRKALEYVLANYEVPDDVAAKLNGMVEQLIKKTDPANRKPSKTQLANDAIRANLLAFFEKHPDERFTCSELAKTCDAVAGKTPQSVSGLVGPMVRDEDNPDGVLTRVKEKGKTYFSLAE